jgi:hypothetical protein
MEYAVQAWLTHPDSFPDVFNPPEEHIEIMQELAAEIWPHGAPYYEPFFEDETLQEVGYVLENQVRSVEGLYILCLSVSTTHIRKSLTIGCIRSLDLWRRPRAHHVTDFCISH